MLFCSVFLQDAYVKYSECVHQIMLTLLKDINSKGKIDFFFHGYIYFKLFLFLANTCILKSQMDSEWKWSIYRYVHVYVYVLLFLHTFYYHLHFDLGMVCNFFLFMYQGMKVIEYKGFCLFVCCFFGGIFFLEMGGVQLILVRFCYKKW